MNIPYCPKCGGNLGVRDEDGELHCLHCGQRQGPPVLPVRLVSSRRLAPTPQAAAGGPP